MTLTLTALSYIKSGAVNQGALRSNGHGTRRKEPSLSWLDSVRSWKKVLRHLALQHNLKLALALQHNCGILLEGKLSFKQCTKAPKLGRFRQYE